MYVGNLVFAVSAEDLRVFVRKILGSSLSVADIRIATDKLSGKKKGFAHIDFNNKKDFDKVICYLLYFKACQVI